MNFLMIMFGIGLVIGPIVIPGLGIFLYKYLIQQG